MRVTILDAMKTIIERTNSNSKVIFKPSRRGNKMLKVIADKRKLFNNEAKFISLQVGLENTLKSIKVKSLQIYQSI